MIYGARDECPSKSTGKGVSFKEVGGGGVSLQNGHEALHDNERSGGLHTSLADDNMAQGQLKLSA